MDSILARFVVVFGGAFLSIAVVMFSFLRRQISDHSKKQKKMKKKGLFGKK